LLVGVQVTFVFVSGKNWRLSLAELISFFEARGVWFRVCQFSRDFFVVSVEDVAGVSAIGDLGGFLKVGRVVAGFATQIVREAFLEGDEQAREQLRREIVGSGLVAGMLGASAAKLVFGVSVYCAEDVLRSVSKVIQRFVGSAVKRELAACGRKSSFMGFSRVRVQPQLSAVEVLKKGLVENRAEMLFCVGKKQTVVAVTVAVHDPFEFQRRDVGKPVQRKIFGLSPRLAKIMVNLALCTRGKLLVDPFCGVGAVLQEALLVGARVVGVDVNPWCVEAAVANLDWLKKEYALEDADYRVVEGDARRLRGLFGEGVVDCVVAEPDLGPALRQVPTVAYAKRVVSRLESLYYCFLEEAYGVLRVGGRLVFVSPFVRTRSGKPVTLAVEEKAVDVGFKQVFPFREKVFAGDVVVKEELAEMCAFVDAEERHIIGRRIHVFQK
jgi:tRNA G10  N-methylase Trm11